jgi:murein DD-endopeptidase MepM/ murein hydrolase activator NlpD
MKKIKALIRIVITILSVALVFGLLGLVGSTMSTANGESTNKNSLLEYENNELTETKNIYGNFMTEIYPVIIGENIDFNKLPVDSIQKYLNQILNLYPNISPIKTIDSIHVSSKFGWRTNPVSGVKHMHTGIDIDMPLGTEIHSTMSGIVEEVIFTPKNGYGKYVVIKNTLGFTTLYAHLNKINVKKGQEIVKNQVIGTLGATGNVTGPNLHYEIFQTGDRKNPLDSLFMLKQRVYLLSLKENSNEDPY